VVHRADSIPRMVNPAQFTEKRTGLPARTPYQVGTSSWNVDPQTAEAGAGQHVEAYSFRQEG